MLLQDMLPNDIIPRLVHCAGYIVMVYWVHQHNILIPVLIVEQINFVFVTMLICSHSCTCLHPFFCVVVQEGGQRMIADAHDNVTILFSDIVGFTTLASMLVRHDAGEMLVRCW